MLSRLLAQRLSQINRSVLLLGPRQTGKTTLALSLSPALVINLMHEPTFLAFASSPQELEHRLRALPEGPTLIFLDEVQRLPSLLNTVQTILDQHSGFRFILTGSSARKLRRGGANLLPGRVISLQLGPLVARELGYKMDAMQAMSSGTLPGIWTEPERSMREQLLASYAATYLKEEVQAEALTRNLEGFARFLFVAAQWSGLYLDLSKMASLSRVPRQTAVRFFEILEDCLIVFRVEPFAKSITRRLTQHPRFYFFDSGVLNGLLGNFTVSSDRIGRLFEHMIASQLYYSALAAGRNLGIRSYRTEQGAEVDFILELDGEVIALELKASDNVGVSDLKGLERFAEYYPHSHRAQIWHLGKDPKRIGDTDVLPWQQGLERLGL